MKKVLVLLLVLGMTSLASAAFTLRVDRGSGWEDIETVTIGVCETIKIGIHCDTAGSYLSGYLMEQNSTLGEWVNTDQASAQIPPCTTDSFVAYLGYHNFGPVTWDSWDLALMTDVGQTGIVANDFIHHCRGVSRINPEHPEWGLQHAIIQIYNDAFGKVDKVIVVQTPEPMTIALLGLGGLFLRRRK